MIVCYFVSLSSITARRHSRGIHSSALLHSAPLNQLAPLDSSPLKYKSDSESVAASFSLFFSPSKSMPACYRHRQDILTPGLQMYRSQSSRIGRVTIYCATMLCLLVMDFLIP